MQTALAVVANVHAGALSNRLKTFEDCDRGGVISTQTLVRGLFAHESPLLKTGSFWLQSGFSQQQAEILSLNVE